MQQDTPQLTEAILEDLLNPAMSPILICEIHGLTLSQLHTLTQSAEYQAAIEAIQSINAARQPVIESQLHLQSQAALKDAADMAHQQSDHESLRKSATVLLRETRPTPSRRPRKPSNNGCHGLTVFGKPCSSKWEVPHPPKTRLAKTTSRATLKSESPQTNPNKFWHAVCVKSPAGIWCPRRDTDTPTTEARHELRDSDLSIRSTLLHPPSGRTDREPRKPRNRRV